jgi:uncharacterized membrane protein YfcA
MIVLGYLLFFCMGCILGTLGAGGAILTMPILVYVFNIPAFQATTSSLMIVGTTALFGTWRYRKDIAYQKALMLSLPSLCAVFLMRFTIIPMIPEDIFGYSRDRLLMRLFAVVLLLVGYLMLNKSNNHTFQSVSNFKAILAGFFLGLLTGLLGIGGGFLIIPLLILVCGLEMKQAVGTSLLMIVLNSWMGLLADRQGIMPFNQLHIIFCTLLSLTGMMIGRAINLHLSSEVLIKYFAYLVLSVACVLIINEFVLMK